MADDLKKMVEQLAAAKAQRRTGKSNRTLSLTEPQFREFQDYCRAQGVSASEVVDQLITKFMDEVVRKAR